MQEMAPDGARDVMLASATPGYVTDPVPDPVTTTDGGDSSGCVLTMTRGGGGRGGPIDPTLPAVALGAALWLMLSHAGRIRPRRNEY
jgi:hypothetical protein